MDVSDKLPCVFGLHGDLGHGSTVLVNRLSVADKKYPFTNDIAFH